MQLLGNSTIADIYTKYHDTVLAVVTRELGAQDAEALCHDHIWEPLLTGELIPPAGSDIWIWLSMTAKALAKRAANQRDHKERRKKISLDTQLADWQLHDWLKEINKRQGNKQPYEDEEESFMLVSMRTVMDSLPPADKEFLIAYQTRTAKELVPRYGSTREAVWQRYTRLKKLINQSLSAIT